MSIANVGSFCGTAADSLHISEFTLPGDLMRTAAMGTSLHKTLASVNIVEVALEKCFLSAVNVGESLANAPSHLAPKSSYQRKNLRVQQMGKRLQSVYSDWYCKVLLCIYGFFSFYCVKIHIHKICHLKYFSVQFSSVNKYIHILCNEYPVLSSSCISGTVPIK